MLWHPWCPHPWRPGRFIFIWPLGSLWGLWPQCMDAWSPPISQTLMTLMRKLMLCFWSLSNPWSDESEGATRVGSIHNSYCLCPQSQPCCGAYPHSWCTRSGGLSLGTSHHSAAPRRLAWVMETSPGCTETWMVLMQVGWNEGGQAPLVWCVLSVMAWVNQPLPIAQAYWLDALSWVCLPTQLMVPDSVNAASCMPHPSSVLLLMTAAPVKQDSPTWASHYSFC